MITSVAIDCVSLPFQSSVGIIDFVSLTIGFILTIPYYGYAYHVAFGWKKLWQATFFLLMLLVIVYGGQSIYSNLSNIVLGNDSITGMLFTMFGLFITYVLSLPVFRYAFKSNQLWQKSA